MNKEITKQQPVNWKEVREKLPYGYMDKIRSILNRSDLSDSLISQVMHEKKTDHHGIRKAALTILKEKIEEEKQLADQYNEIIKSA